MPEANLTYALTLAPKQAVEYFRAKGYAITWDWTDMWQQAHARAFTVAKVARMDVLQDIRGMVDKAISEGTTLAQFQKDLAPRLAAKGWWGSSTHTGADGKEQTVQLGSMRRLRTIYEANTQSAYMAGRWKEQSANAADAPDLMYVVVMDSRTRPAHAALNGQIFPITDPFWQSFYPPNGFGCRCRTRSISKEYAAAKGLTVGSSGPNLKSKEVPVSEGNPKKTTVATYHDPATGRTISPDPGWSHNPGVTDWKPDLSAYDKDIRAAAAAEKTPPPPPVSAPASAEPAPSSIIYGKSPHIPAGLAKIVAKDTLPDGFWNAMGREVKVRKGPGIKSYYSPGSDTVTMALQGHLRDVEYKKWVTAHEFAHAYCEKTVLSDTTALAKVRSILDDARKEFSALPLWAKSDLTLAALQQRYESASKRLGLELSDINHKKHLSALDTVASLTSGTYGIGHKLSYWRRDINSPLHEFHSHAAEHYFFGNPYLEELLPKAAKAMEDYCRGVFGDR